MVSVVLNTSLMVLSENSLARSVEYMCITILMHPDREPGEFTVSWWAKRHELKPAAYEPEELE